MIAREDAEAVRLTVARLVSARGRAVVLEAQIDELERTRASAVIAASSAIGSAYRRLVEKQGRRAAAAWEEAVGERAKLEKGIAEVVRRLGLVAGVLLEQGFSPLELVEELGLPREAFGREALDRLDREIEELRRTTVVFDEQADQLLRPGQTGFRSDLLIVDDVGAAD